LTDSDSPSTESSRTPARRGRNYLASVVTTHGVIILSVAVTLWLTPFSLKYLSRSEYALFVFSNDLLTWLIVLDLGITSGLRAQVAQLTGRPNSDALNRLVSTSFFTQLVLSLVMLVTGIGLSVFAPGLFRVSPELQGQAATVLLLLTIGFAINFSTQTFSSLLYAHQQIHYDNAIRVLQLVVRTVLTFYLLIAGWKVVALAIANLASVAVFSFLAIIRAYQTVPGLSINRRLAAPSVMWRDFKKLHLWYALGNFAGTVIQSTDRIVATRLLSLVSVATLTLTGRSYELAFLLLTPLTGAAQPGIGQLLGADRHDAAFAAYRQLVQLTVGLGTVGALSLWSGNGAFVNRWVGAENYGGATLDVVMMCNLILVTWTMPQRMALISGLRARPQALTRGLEALLNISLSVLFARRYGLVGIAVATTIASLCTSFWQLPRLAADYFGVGLGKLLRTTVVPLIPALLALVPIAIGLRLLVAERGGFLNAIISMVIVGVCGITLLWIVFEPGLRLRVRQTLRSLASTS